MATNAWSGFSFGRPRAQKSSKANKAASAAKEKSGRHLTRVLQLDQSDTLLLHLLAERRFVILRPCRLGERWCPRERDTLGAGRGDGELGRIAARVPRSACACPVHLQLRWLEHERDDQ